MTAKVSRPIMSGVAQLGPIAREESRASVIARMIALLDKAYSCGCKLVVFPELALTTFFPRWFIDDQHEIDSYFETEMPSAETRPLFDKAREYGISFYLGYAELVVEAGQKRHFNTAILVNAQGEIISKYRKIHLPGHREHEPWRAFQHLEKRYFAKGNFEYEPVDALGGQIGMALCNDRRWPEMYRVYALKGAEMLLLGYNTPLHYPPVPEHDHLQGFHNHICMQAGAYQNGMWVLAAAKAGKEEGCDLLGQSCIIAPTGEIVTQASTVKDELITYECDFERTREIKDHIFNFSLHREPQHYSVITAPK